MGSLPESVTAAENGIVGTVGCQADGAGLSSGTKGNAAQNSVQIDASAGQAAQVASGAASGPSPAAVASAPASYHARSTEAAAMRGSPGSPSSSIPAAVSEMQADVGNITEAEVLAAHEAKSFDYRVRAGFQ
jgi:hypothetical protein